MKLEYLEIHNFRNILDTVMEDTQKVNLLVGENGSGKTSILEAIYFLGLARSFRTVQSNRLINHNSKSFLLFTRISRQGEKQQIGIEKFTDSVNLRINGESVKNNSLLAKCLPVQIINTNVHELIDEGPSYRRKFLEWGVFHVEHRYGDISSRLRQILKQRNAGLKKHISRDHLKHWDTELIQVAQDIHQLREKYFLSIKPYVEALIGKQQLVPELTLEYKKGWPEDQDYSTVLQSNWESDKETGYTRLGPHKADVIIKSQSYLAKHELSRGQQKLVACILRLAQINFLRDQTGGNIVLMIDDLAAELDMKVREFLLTEAIHSDAQLFVTSTEPNMLELDRMGVSHKLFHVEHGSIK